SQRDELPPQRPRRSFETPISSGRASSYPPEGLDSPVYLMFWTIDRSAHRASSYSISAVDAQQGSRSTPSYRDKQGEQHENVSKSRTKLIFDLTALRVGEVLRALAKNC